MKPRALSVPAVLMAISVGCVVPVHRGRVAVIAPVPVVSFRYVAREPPPVRYERIPSPPSEDHVWVAGFWSWDGGAYLWVPGRYQPRPHRRAVWVDGHWSRHQDHGWYWTEGRWR